MFYQYWWNIYTMVLVRVFESAEDSKFTVSKSIARIFVAPDFLRVVADLLTLGYGCAEMYSRPHPPFLVALYSLIQALIFISFVLLSAAWEENIENFAIEIFISTRR